MKRVWPLVVLGLLPLVPAAAVAGTAPPPPHHDVRLTYDPSERRLYIVDRITVEGRQRLALGVAPWLQITELRVDGRAVTLRGGTIGLPGGGRHQVRVSLRGQVPPLPQAVDRSDAGRALAGEAGLYLPGSAGWLPDTGDGAVTYRLIVRTPASIRAVATGTLAEDVAEGEERRATIVADRPMEPPSLFAGPYEVVERRSPGVRLRTYFHAELADLAEDYLDQAARFIARYADEIGPYPYQDFHIVSSPLPVGLGFPTLTYVGRRVLPLPFKRGRSLAHEVLHSWWGNAVGVDYAAGNWAEGLTTYMADHALAADRGVDAAARLRLGWLRDYAALPPSRDQPVRAFVSKRHQAAQVIGYNKAAIIFHMLRREVGEAAYADALRRFYRDHTFRIAGWADIRRAFSAAAGRDLNWFFEQWLNRAGAPRIELVSAAAAIQTPEDGPARYGVSLRLRQSVPLYRLALPVVIETTAGPVRAQVQLADAEQTLKLDVNAPPTRVSIDPEFEVFRRLLPGESPPILRDVTLAAAPVAAIVTDDEDVRTVAARLATWLLDTRPRLLAPGRLPRGNEPALLIGLDDDMARVAAVLGLAPPAPATSGTARAWAARTQSGASVYAVSARDKDALIAIVRPLPHYGRHSYVVFDDGRAVAKGLWPATDSPLSRPLHP